VREIDPDIRVIMVSAYTENVVQYLLGGDADIHFLHKPFDRRGFVATVAEVLAADISLTEQRRGSCLIRPHDICQSVGYLGLGHT
jgi:hypothetical protein